MTEETVQPTKKPFKIPVKVIQVDYKQGEKIIATLYVREPFINEFKNQIKGTMAVMKFQKVFTDLGQEGFTGEVPDGVMQDIYNMLSTFVCSDPKDMEGSRLSPDEIGNLPQSMLFSEDGLLNTLMKFSNPTKAAATQN